MEEAVLKYFASIGIPIFEIYGQSECTGPQCVDSLKAFKLGTVGRPLLGTESRIASDTGELLYQGRHIFSGYMNMPDKTEEAIDNQGWLHSGDIAKIDDDNDARIPKPSGFVTITGRIKELIVTAGGENVPPAFIEENLKAAIPSLSNAMVIGDKRKFLSVLLCLQVDVDNFGIPSDKLTDQALQASKEIGSTAKTTSEARIDPKWQEYFNKGIETANKKAHSRAQNVAKWYLLSTDFSEKGGELTPTLKLKRAFTAEKYRDVVEKIYA